MKNLKKLFLLILLSSFSANFSAFGMNSDSENKGEKQGTKRKFDETEQVVEQEEKINKIELSNDILDYEDIIGLIASKFNTVQDFYNFKLVCKKFNEATNNKVFIRAFLEKQMLSKNPTQIELTNIQAFNNYLKEQIDSFTLKYFPLLRDSEISEIREIVVNLSLKNTNADNTKLLCIAAQNGHLEIVKLLITNGADVNAARNDGITSLLIAAQNGHLEVVKLLITNGADVNVARNDGITPLHLAAENGHTEVVRVLLTHLNIDVNANYLGRTALCAAAVNGHTEVVKLLITNGADVKVARNDGITPLWLAAVNGHTEVVQFLTDNGADVNKANNDGASPLHLAAYKNYIEVVKLLITNGADVNKANNDGASPLHLAAVNGHTEVVKFLTGDVNKADNNGITPLYIAAYKNYIEVVKLLITNGADVNKTTNNGTTPLFIAAENGHFEVVQFLITKGAKVNKADKDGITPLWIAAQNGHFEVVRVLLTNGAKVNKADKDGQTPLHMATKSGWDSKIKVIKELLNCGADVSIADKSGAKPLVYARDYATVKIFLNHHNFSVNAELVENTGLTFLHIAVGCSEIKYLKKLLEKTDIDVNANFNAEKFSRRVDETPLYIAAQVDNIKVVQLLLKHRDIIVRQQDLEIENLTTEVRVLLQKKFDKQQSQKQIINLKK